MGELAEERRAIQAGLSEYHMYGWLWEVDAGARPEPTRSTYLAEVEASDVYVGLFWLGYGQYTIEEFEHARKHKKPCLIYEKNVNIDYRTRKLKAFLKTIQQPENVEGLTIYRFKTPEELTKQLQKDLISLLTRLFREGH